MLNIAIRADGGKNIGLGHIMRCLSLAKAFQQQGCKVYFLSKFDEGIEKVKGEKFEVIRLPSVEERTEGFFYGNPADLGAEANTIISLLHQYKIDVLIIDSYNISEEYFLDLKPHVTKLAYIDDVNQFVYPVDFIINGNITGEYMGYAKYNESQVLLLGPKYNLIRSEFNNLPPRNIKAKVEEVMITTGGADPYGLTTKLLKILLPYEPFTKIRFNVLIGSSFTDCKELIQIRKKYKNVFLYANSRIVDKYSEITFSEVAPLMLRSDLAISAGGSTLYEFAACGTPVRAFILADNQEFIVQKMDELGYIKSLGWYNQLDEYKLMESLYEMVKNYPARVKMSRQGQTLVDGKGTERIACEIIGKNQHA